MTAAPSGIALLHFEDSQDDEKDQHMRVIEVRFKLEKETKGALRCQEAMRKRRGHRASLG